MLESREPLVFINGGLAGVVDVCVGVAGEVGSTLRVDDTADEEGVKWSCKTSGSVPDRFRVSSWREAEVEFGDIMGWGVPRNCAAEADGRSSRRRGATDPTVTRDWRDAMSSSPDFPPDDTAEPFSEGVSVEAVAALPLRCRSLYFSIASASRSRMRVAMGDSPAATL